MTITEGQRLGKYELIEKVGQGGMAVVYRGHDTALKREVAVKILHPHLAEHEEARVRFGREAHAVAKLRHENILEIHDFSGEDSEQNYIVTEFIDGCTLKEFMTENPIRFPEVGAMIVVQVCRALAHAHGLGVLHRDVKPENVMIRSDGVVKLTDFGIAQMIDLRRMTVTGQLLGSPAYMSPEHVVGGELDFRTDVFAVGIVLYQLVTGELPFEGKNPHEILKRIADCKYTEPSRVNARVGRELEGIIMHALARNADDRYADVSLMQQALEEYLEGSGMEGSKEELERFFASPASYQMALEQRLTDYLCERAKLLLPKNRAKALELFNRVLSIDKDNVEVLSYLSRAGARQRNMKIAAAIVGVALFAALAMAAKSRFAAEGHASVAIVYDAAPATTNDAYVSPAADAQVAIVPLADADTIATTLPPDAKPLIRDPQIPRKRRPDGGTLTPKAKPTRYVLKLTPRNSEYRIAGGPWKKVSGSQVEFEAGPGDTRVTLRNSSCCQEASALLPRDAVGSVLKVNLRYLPGQITPRCNTPGVKVKVNGRTARLNKVATIPVTRITGTESVAVEFFSEQKVDEQRVTIKATEAMEVVCRF
jgi:serine/threonine-protein kinase